MSPRLYIRISLAFVFFFAALMVHIPAAFADNSLSVTVTPPLFQLTITPGETWQSSIKIVNNNSYDVTYYAQAVDMQASGEDGRSKFIPLVDTGSSTPPSTLARWIDVSRDGVAIPAGQSKEVPFAVSIPKNAEPGGHYAAIMIGTEPGGIHASGTLVKISSFVSTLIFVRIKGDVTESGRIREFLTSQSIYQDPKVDFTLRFENTGNVHLQPQGEITISNMWGKERGKVLINQNSEFGNVLPQSIRRFDFSWQGDSDPFDIGLYSAAVTLTYGQDGKHNTSAQAYFWVVPIVPISIGGSIFLVAILLLIWFIRRYIRRALALEAARFGAPVQASRLETEAPVARPTPKPQTTTVQTLMEPLRAGVIDLRHVAGKKTETSAPPVWEEGSPETLWQLFLKYRLFVAFLAVVVLVLAAGSAYFGSVFSASRHFQITDVHIQAEPLAK